MPLTLPDKLPAIELLKNENIFVMNSTRADLQDIRPLRIACLNLMPIKVTTETDIVRLLSNTPLQIELEFIKLHSHKPTHTPIEHLMEFYIDFEEVKKHKYDGLIVTGAPVEHLEYDQVTYWGEVKEIFDWARTNVTSTFFFFFSAQAALYHYYGIKKYPLTKKMFGVFEHVTNDSQNPLFRGFDDVFYMRHSRHTEIRREDIERVENLQILAESADAGVSIVMGKDGREIFITGHAEYSPYTLDEEYKRDISKGLPIDIPRNYYPQNNPNLSPLVRWRSHANLLYTNWLNYFVYQVTPFDINTIE